MQLLFLFSFTALFSSSVTTNEIALRNLIPAIWKSVLLLGNEYKEFDVDGLLGYKVLQVQLKGIIEKCSVKKHPAICLSLERMSDLLNDSLIKANYYTKQRDPKYFDELQDIFRNDQLWTFTSSWNQTRPELVYTELIPHSSEYFTEEFSDRCICFLLGSATEEKGPCFVSTRCREKMTQLGCSGYSLSHQLLYFIFGKGKGCTNDLFVKDAPYYMNVFCANIMERNVEIESNGYPLEDRDLFMENRNNNYLVRTENQSKPEKSKMEKRRARIFLGTCESHETSMAVGSLAGFLHFIYTPTQ
ncbi:UPF0764 protein C16orf89 homolog isoform X2 [Hyperolius riggenbachi]|uniref:UPF0764 protein C16orf89 homolog isoform X2 n=1 Tax=Hyperolius riggenbachi TaxID=752182 RepID=UPI0035A3C6DA